LLILGLEWINIIGKSSKIQKWRQVRSMEDFNMKQLRIKCLAMVFLLSAVISICSQDAKPQGSKETECNRKGLEYYNEAFYRHTPNGNKPAAEQYFEKAAAEFKQAIALNSRYAEAHHNLARLYYVREQYQEAIDAYQAFLFLNPDDIDSYVQMALAYTRLDRYRDAIQQLEMAKSRTTDHEVIDKLNSYIQKAQEHK
jgi:tetratricopeptide (TPR) repeat protein